jgi:hypothetical protein
MRKKVSTIMDASLFQRAKVEAARQGKPMSAILEEALEAYLTPVAGPMPEGRSLVDASWGAFSASPEVIRAVMEDENGWLDT